MLENHRDKCARLQREVRKGVGFFNVATCVNILGACEPPLLPCVDATGLFTISHRPCFARLWISLTTVMRQSNVTRLDQRYAHACHGHVHSRSHEKQLDPPWEMERIECRPSHRAIANSVFPYATPLDDHATSAEPE